MTTPRALTLQREEIEEIELHGFGDASVNGVSATVYAVVKQRSGVNAGLVAAKARLAKQGLTIPRLELVSAHMATNLIHNVRRALEGFPVKQSFGWLDSTVALHWVKGGGEYKQFVMNRVRKIQAHSEIIWGYVPTQENPADLGSRGGQMTDNPLWWEGPRWLTREAEWPPDLVTSASPETIAEAKATREIFAVAVAATASDELDVILDKFCDWKAIRVCAWIKRFLFNVRTRKTSRTTGPLTTQELKLVKLLWEKRVQERAKKTSIIKRTGCNSIFSLTQMGYWSAEAGYRVTIRCTYQTANYTQRSWWNMRTSGHFMGESHHGENTRTPLGTTIEKTSQTYNQGMLRMSKVSTQGLLKPSTRQPPERANRGRKPVPGHWS